MVTSLPDVWHIYGQVLQADNTTVFTQGKIRAIDMQDQEYQLGESGIGSDGKFTITYSKWNVQRGDANITSPKLVLRVLDFQENILWQSAIIYPITPEYTYNISLAPGTPQKWKIDGNVKLKGVVLTEGKVSVIDLYNGVETILSECLITPQGTYHAEYDESSFKKVNTQRTNPNVFFRIYNKADVVIGKTAPPVTPSTIFTYNIELTTTHTLSGFVKNESGKGVGGVTICLYLIQADPSGFKEIPLGNTISDEKGNYLIHYTSNITNSNTPKLLTIKITAQIDTTNIAKNAMTLTSVGEEQVYDVNVIASSDIDDSECSRLFELLKVAGFDPKTNPDLIEQIYGDPARLAYVSSISGLPENQINDLATAAKVFSELKTELQRVDAVNLPALISMEIIFTLIRDAQVVDLKSLRVLKPEIFQKTIVNSLTTNILPPTLNDTLSQIIDEWRSIYSLLLADKSWTSSIIDICSLISEKKNEVIDIYAAYGQDMIAFYKELDKSPILTEEDILRIHYAFDSYEFCDRFMPLARKVTEAIFSYKLSDTAAFDLEKWKTIVDSVVPDPTIDPNIAWLAVDYVPGETADEKKSNYAVLLQKKAQTQFVMTSFRNDINVSIDTKWQNIITFFNATPEFDLATNFITDTELPLPEDVEMLRIVQRLYRITQKFTVINDLIINNLTSSYAITRIDRDLFIAENASIAGGEDEARAIYDGALHMASQAMFVVGAYHDQLQLDENSIPALSQHSESKMLAKTLAISLVPPEQHANASTTMTPNLSTLFGSYNQMSCSSCQSVTSQSAYLVDLLQFLDTSIRSKLFSRRFDLSETDLSCQNTNGSVKYIDLVNEVLENAVCSRSFYIRETQAVRTSFISFLNKPSTDTNANFDAACNQFTIRGFTFDNRCTTASINTTQWYASDDLWRYMISETADKSALEIIPFPKTGSDADLRETLPEHTHKAAYDVLKIPIFPMVLPFDLQSEEVFQLFKVKNTEWYKLYKTINNISDTNAVFNSTVNRLFLQITKEQKELIVTNPAQPFELWGLNESDNKITTPDGSSILEHYEWFQVLSNVAVLLNRANINFDHLLDILSTGAINLNGSLFLKFDTVAAEKSVDLNHLYLQNNPSNIKFPSIDPNLGTTFTKIARFLRLWRQCAIDIFTLDRVLLALCSKDNIRNGNIIPTDLNSFSQVFQIAESFNVPILSAVAWLKRIDFINLGRGPKSLLETLFIDNIADPVRKKVWSSLINNYDATGLFDTGKDGEELHGDIPTLLAGLQCTWDDFTVILHNEFATGIDQDPYAILKETELSIDTLTRMFAVVSFSKSLSISIADYYIVRMAMGIADANAFDIDKLYEIRETVHNLLESKIGIDEAGHMLTNNAVYVPWFIKKETAISTIRKVQDQYNEIVKSSVAADLSSTIQKELHDGIVADIPLTKPKAVKLITDLLITYEGEIEISPSVRQTAANRVNSIPNIDDIAVEELLLQILKEMFGIIAINKQLKRLLITQLAMIGKITQENTLYLLETILKSFTYDTYASSGILADAQITYPQTLPDVSKKAIDSLIDAVKAPTLWEPFAVDSLVHPIWSILIQFRKAARLLEALSISNDDFSYLYNHSVPLGILDFTLLPASQKSYDIRCGYINGLITVCDLKQSIKLADTSQTIFTLWQKIADTKYTRTQFENLVIAQTGWNKEIVSTILKNQYLNSPQAYTTPGLWLHLKQCQKLLTASGISASFAIQLCPSQQGDNGIPITFEQSRSLRSQLKSQFSKEQWKKTVVPIQDTLRRRQRDALIAYLLTNRKSLSIHTVGNAMAVNELYIRVNHVYGGLTVKEIFDTGLQNAIIQIQTWKHIAANGELNSDNDPTWKLFDTRENFIDRAAIYAYFLMDIEMEPIIATTRIVQAINTVQSYIQRILLKFEKGIVPRDKFRLEWSWIKNYRLWEANRKIFLYPENWIEPELRDDKTPLFKDVETALLQKELTKDTIEDAFKAYTQGLADVSNLEVIGSYQEQSNGELILHIIGRTYHHPHQFYYRRQIEVMGGESHWTPWEKVELDITSEVVIPVTFNKKLYLYWPLFENKEMAIDKLNEVDNKNEKVTLKYLEIKLAWSEYDNGNWSAKRISKDAYSENQYPQLFGNNSFLISGDEKQYIFRAQSNSNNIVINIDYILKFWYDSYAAQLATFEYTIENALKLEYICQIARNDFYYYPANNLSFPDLIPNNSSLIRNSIQENIETGDSTNDLSIPDNNLLFKETPGSYKLFLTNYSIAEHVLEPIFYTDDKYSFLLKNTSSISQDNKDTSMSITPEGTKYSFSIEPTFHPHAQLFLQRALYQNIDNLLTRESQVLWETNNQYNGGYIGYHLAGDEFSFHNAQIAFKSRYLPSVNVEAPYPLMDVDFTNEGAYSIYNWELFFHLPLLIATRLSNDLRFEDAMRWFHFIFNPDGDFNSYEATQRWAWELPEGSKFWTFLPFFANRGAKESLNASLSKTNKEEDTVLGKLIEAWKINPFKPHLIARYRTVAYQKTVIMKYLDNLVNWGDSLFKIDTMETINEATKLYMYASQILGERPIIIDNPEKIPSLSYTQLDKIGLNSFSNTSIKLENYIPAPPRSKVKLWKTAKKPSRYYYYYYYGGQSGSDSMPRSVQPLLRMSSVMGYFCLPVNDQLYKYWDIVESRLFNIRNSRNVNGMQRTLALFGAPIDPGMLVRAAAAGIDIGDILNDMNVPMLPYRFQILLQKALEITNEVKTLGSQLLSALEKRDAEYFALLLKNNEIEMNSLITSIKSLQINEAKSAIEALQKSRESAEKRHDYYQNIEKINPMEVAQLALLVRSGIMHAIGQVLTLTSAAISVIPDFYAGAIASFPPGVLVLTKLAGGEKSSKPLSTVGSALMAGSEILDRVASITGTLASYKRRWEEWKLQESLAGKEIEQIDKQIEGAKIRFNIAEKDLENHQKQIEQLRATKEVMTSKYTNLQLYEWMKNQLATLHHSSYNLAYQLSKKAQSSFHFEIPNSDDQLFIKPEFWDSSKMGLLAGERLTSALRQMECAYLEKNNREFEITKTVSLKLLDPEALFKLQTEGTCDFSVPELIFDFDFPGHYFRRIKSVRVSIPCITGPYTNVSATLTMTKNVIRKDDDLDNDKYPPSTDSSNSIHFINRQILTNAIATSSASMDSGTFEFNFRDDRYLPFEGAGVISSWQLDLPAEYHQFDYSTISDVVMHISYSARQGDTNFKGKVNDYLKSEIAKIGNFPLLISLKDFSMVDYANILNGKQGTFDLDIGNLPFGVIDFCERNKKSISYDTVKLLIQCTKKPDLTKFQIKINGKDIEKTKILNIDRIIEIEYKPDSGIGLPGSIKIETLTGLDSALIEGIYLMLIKSN